MQYIGFTRESYLSESIIRMRCGQKCGPNATGASHHLLHSEHGIGQAYMCAFCLTSMTHDQLVLSQPPQLSCKSQILATNNFDHRMLTLIMCAEALLGCSLCPRAATASLVDYLGCLYCHWETSSDTNSCRITSNVTTSYIASYRINSHI